MRILENWMMPCSQMERPPQSRFLLCGRCDIVEWGMLDSETILWGGKASPDVQSWHVSSFWILQCWQKNRNHIVNPSGAEINVKSVGAWPDRVKCCSLPYRTLEGALWLSKILRHWQSVNVYLDIFSDEWTPFFPNRSGGLCKQCRSEGQDWTDTWILKNIKHSYCCEQESWQSESWRQQRVMRLTSSHDQSSLPDCWGCKSMSLWKKMRAERNLTWRDHFSSSDHNMEKTWF